MDRDRSALRWRTDIEPIRGRLRRREGDPTDHLVEDELVVGREPDCCGLVISDDLQISRVHARVRRADRGFLLIDEGSRNGTFLNGDRITGTVAIRHGDVIRFGRTEFHFVLDAPPPVTDPGRPTILAAVDAGEDPLAIRIDQADAAQLRRAHDRLRILYKMTGNLSTTRPIPVLLRDILDELFELLPVERGVIMLRTGDGKMEVAARKSRDDGDEGGEVAVSSTLLEHVLDRLQAIFIPDATQDLGPARGASVILHQMRSIACVPMVIRHQGRPDVVGVIQVHSTRQEHTLMREDLDLLLGIGSVAAIAIENARLYQDQRDRLRQLQAVYEVERSIHESDTLESFVQLLLEKATEAMDAGGGALLLQEPSSGEKVYRHRRAGAPESPPREEKLLRQVTRSGESILVDDPGTGDDRDDPAGGPRVGPAPGAQSAIAVPLKLEDPQGSPDEILGSLEVVRESTRAFSQTDLSVLQILGAQLSSALLRKRMIQDREKTKRLATIGSLASTIIHDFKNPMSVALGYVELMQRDLAPPEKRTRYCRVVREEILRCVTMTQELLNFARGQHNFNLQQVETAAFLDEIAMTLENEMQRHKVDFRVEDTYQGTVVMDLDKMKRVIFNLSSNALRVLQEGDLFAIRCAPIDGLVELRIEDGGPGIPAEIRESLFEAFVTHGHAEGTGLGLSIAKDIVTKHGGSIHLDPDLPRGTCFVIRLPPKGPEETDLTSG